MFADLSLAFGHFKDNYFDIHLTQNAEEKHHVKHKLVKHPKSNRTQLYQYC